MVCKIQNLIVDTNAFINNVQLQDRAVNIFTVSEVVEEVKSKRQLRNLVVLPYNLQVKDVDPESLDFVVKFAKKTGDYSFLSTADIKLIALTYQLEREHMGTDHLRTTPVTSKTVESIKNSQPKLLGFYLPDEVSSTDSSNEELNKEDLNNVGTIDFKATYDENISVQEVPDIDFEDTLLPQFSKLSCRGSHPECETDNSETNDEDFGYTGADCGDKDDNVDLDPCITDGDDSGWITPSNSRANEIDTNLLAEEKIIVACYSTDFSIQNMLKQIGLNVISKDGVVIKYLNTYILRCYACFHISPETTRIFCPKCGNKTLKRVCLTVDTDGNQHININFRRPLTARGKKFPLPRPRGGKHAVNPILCEDQRVPQQRLSKLALIKNNPMHPDYIAGTSPFVMRDVSSRSATVNATNKSEIKYWMRRNPNEVVKKRRKK